MTERDPAGGQRGLFDCIQDGRAQEVEGIALCNLACAALVLRQLLAVGATFLSLA